MLEDNSSSSDGGGGAEVTGVATTTVINSGDSGNYVGDKEYLIPWFSGLDNGRQWWLLRMAVRAKGGEDGRLAVKVLLR